MTRKLERRNQKTLGKVKLVEAENTNSPFWS